MTTFVWAFKLESLLRFRQWHQLIQPLLLFILVAILFPLSLPMHDPSLLQSIAPGIIWVTALLAILMGLDQLFQEDYRDGTLEQYVLSKHSLTPILLAKIIVFWLGNGLIISLLSPIIAYAFGLSGESVWLLFVSISLGTLTLSLIGAVGAALILTTRQGQLLLALLNLPLYIPVVIFGAGAIPHESVDSVGNSGLYFLTAMLVLALTLCPTAIRLIIENTLD